MKPFNPFLNEESAPESYKDLTKPFVFPHPLKTHYSDAWNKAASFDASGKTYGYWIHPAWNLQLKVEPLEHTLAATLFMRSAYVNLPKWINGSLSDIYSAMFSQGWVRTTLTSDWGNRCFGIQGTKKPVTQVLYQVLDKFSKSFESIRVDVEAVGPCSFLSPPTMTPVKSKTYFIPKDLEQLFRDFK